MLRSDNASYSAASSTISARDTLIRKPVGFVKANSRRPIVPIVPVVAEMHAWQKRSRSALISSVRTAVWEELMAYGVNRFLTTHTGSLPRPDDLIRAMFAKEEGVPVDRAALGQGSAPPSPRW